MSMRTSEQFHVFITSTTMTTTTYAQKSLALPAVAYTTTVTIDCRLTMTDHVTAVVRTGYVYFWLRQLRSVVQSLTSEAAESLVHAFVSCRLDYCNALLYSIADGQLQRLQSVQNAAARLVTGTRRTDYITPVLQSLHWLPVRQRVTFHFQVGDTGSQVLERLSTWIFGRWHPSCWPPSSWFTVSRASMMLDIPRTTTSLRDGAFAVAGPRIWNSLPRVIRDPSLSLSVFRKLLKTYLFV